MNIVKGSIFTAKIPIFTGNWRNAKYSHDATITAVILADSYGEKTGQHSFTFEIIESDDAEFVVAKKYRKMGRNLYPNIVEIKSPGNYEEVAQEKKERAKNQSAKARRDAMFGG